MSVFQKLKSFFFQKLVLKLLLAIGLIYVVVVWGTMFYLDSYTNHGEQIAVPNLKGKNINTIQPLMAELNLTYEVLDSIFEPSLAPGTIVDQNPKPTDVSEVFVKEGRVIRLRVSKRSRLIEMPDMVDKSQRFAESILDNMGIKYKITYKNSIESAGAVLEQSFKGQPLLAGTKIQLGSTIQLVIGRNEGGMPVPVPDLYGITISEAKMRLEALGGVSLFMVCPECQTAQDSVSARISSQSPAFSEGAMMSPGSTMTINAVLNLPDTLDINP